jgi:hypothetical protein
MRNSCLSQRRDVSRLRFQLNVNTELLLIKTITI